MADDNRRIWVNNEPFGNRYFFGYDQQYITYYSAQYVSEKVVSTRWEQNDKWYGPSPHPPAISGSYNVRCYFAAEYGTYVLEFSSNDLVITTRNASSAAAEYNVSVEIPEYGELLYRYVGKEEHWNMLLNRTEILVDDPNYSSYYGQVPLFGTVYDESGKAYILYPEWQSKVKSDENGLIDLTGKRIVITIETTDKPYRDYYDSGYYYERGYIDFGEIQCVTRPTTTRVIFHPEEGFYFGASSMVPTIGSLVCIGSYINWPGGFTKYDFDVTGGEEIPESDESQWHWSLPNPDGHVWDIRKIYRVTADDLVVTTRGYHTLTLNAAEGSSISAVDSDLNNYASGDILRHGHELFVNAIAINGYRLSRFVINNIPRPISDGNNTERIQIKYDTVISTEASPITSVIIFRDGIPELYSIHIYNRSNKRWDVYRPWIFNGTEWDECPEPTL